MALMSLNDFISGSLAGVMQVFSGQPFDLLKVKMQTQVGSAGIVEIAKDIFSSDGIKGFYKGTLSPLIGISFCVSIQFGANEFMKNVMQNYKKTNDLTPLNLATSGGFAGFCSAFIASPVELLRIKLQAQDSASTKFTGSIQCLRYLFNTHGLKGVYQGLSITIIREIPAYFFYFGVYESLMKNSLKTYKNRESIPMYMISIYGALGGLSLWLSVYPVDVIKSRMQSDTITDPKYSSNLDCAKKIYAEQGVPGFFKGIKPCLLRAAIANTATFITFEKVNGYLKRRDKLKNKL